MNFLMFAQAQVPTGPLSAAIQISLGKVNEFISSDAIVAAQVIFGTIVVLHALLGAAELLTGEESRLTSGKFYVRIVFAGLLTFGFSIGIVNGFGKTLVTASSGKIIETYGMMWGEYWDSSFNSLETGPQGTNNGFFQAILFVLELIVDAVGFLFLIIISLLLMLYVLLQALVGIGSTLLVLAMGPVCLAFAAHESTQDIAISYAKTFLVYVVFYLPLLVLAFEIALSVMMSYSATSYYQKGDMLNFAEHLLGVLIAPLAAVALVQAAPNVIKGALK